jgi:hypothetical protein
MLSAGSASAVSIFSDNFDRANNNSVGAPWLELQSGADDVSIESNNLLLRDTLSGQPDSAAAAGLFSTAGLQNITLNFDWRALATGQHTNDVLHVGYMVINSPAGFTTTVMQNEGSWTEVFAQSSGNINWNFVVNLALGAAAADSQIALMFWTQVNSATEGFRIDNVVLTGNAIQPVPLPGALLLMVTALAGLAGVRGIGEWRRGRMRGGMA